VCVCVCVCVRVLCCLHPGAWPSETFRCVFFISSAVKHLPRRESQSNKGATVGCVFVCVQTLPSLPQAHSPAPLLVVPPPPPHPLVVLRPSGTTNTRMHMQTHRRTDTHSQAYTQAHMHVHSLMRVQAFLDTSHKALHVVTPTPGLPLSPPLHQHRHMSMCIAGCTYRLVHTCGNVIVSIQTLRHLVLSDTCSSQTSCMQVAL